MTDRKGSPREMAYLASYRDTIIDRMEALYPKLDELLDKPYFNHEGVAPALEAAKEVVQAIWGRADVVLVIPREIYPQFQAATEFLQAFRDWEDGKIPRTSVDPTDKRHDDGKLDSGAEELPDEGSDSQADTGAGQPGAGERVRSNRRRPAPAPVTRRRVRPGS